MKKSNSASGGNDVSEANDISESADINDGFVLIDGESFSMGSPVTENWRIDDELLHICIKQR